MGNKISVVVVAHNEEKYIKRCLSSLSKQSLKPAEVILIAHLCDDETISLAKQFSEVKIIDLGNPSGTVYARMKGFEEAKSEVVAFLDGDAYADKNWLKELVGLLKDPKVVGVGGYVAMRGSLLARLMSWTFFFWSPVFKRDHHFFFWGANFACRKKDYEKGGGLKGLIPLRKSLLLNYWAEDLYLSLVLEKLGRVVFARKAKVWAWAKNKESWQKRFKKQAWDSDKLFDYFGVNSKNLK